MTKAKVLRLDLDDVTLKTLTQSLVWFWFFIWVYYNITETLANVCSNMNYIIGHYQNNPYAGLCTNIFPSRFVMRSLIQFIRAKICTNLEYQKNEYAS